MASSLRTRTEARTAPDAPRPLVLLSVLGGLTAALGPLLVLLAVGVIGWFLSDAGAHGTPRDGMRMGTLAWLAGHGSGLQVGAVTVTVVPLGLTAICAWTIWRLGLRVGDSISGHGPDADRIGDGERDFAVPSAVLGFTGAYVVVAVVAASLASADAVGISMASVVTWSVTLCVLVAGTGIAIGSGRAAIWAASVSAPVRVAVSVAARVVRAFVLVSFVVFVVNFALNIDEAATVFSRLHTDAGDATLYGAVSALFVPNATLLSGAYLLGPGFVAGAGSIVSPSVTVLGPLPLFPLVAALPEPGSTALLPLLALAIAPLTAAWATLRALRRATRLGWDHTLLAGTGGGLVAGLVMTAAIRLAGGVAGPGRMREVGANTAEILVHALPAFGIGALLAAMGLVAVRWRRGEYERASVESVSDAVPDPGRGTSSRPDSDAESPAPAN